MNKLYNLAKYCFDIFIVIILLSFTDTGKKVINNIIYNLYKTTNYIFSEQYVVKYDSVLVVKYILYIFLISYCLLFCLCNFIKNVYKYIDNKVFRKKTKEQGDSKLMNYIANKRVQYVFIDGEWGIGKTHYVLNQLEEMNKEYYYVSLFGLKSRKLVIEELINEVKSKSNFRIVFDIPILRTVFNVMYSIDGLDILKTGTKKIIVFDDLERVSGVINNDNNDKEYEAKFEDYNDIIGFIEYISHNYKEYTCIVIMNQNKMKNVFELLIQPKLKPHILSIPFTEEKIEKISKEYLKDVDKEIIKLYTEIYTARREIKENEKLTYRPFVRELEVLSTIKERETIINIALSEFIALFNLPSLSEGELISIYWKQIKKKATPQQLSVIYDLENCIGMKKYINDGQYKSKVNIT